MSHDRVILTPEHVEVRLHPAGPGSRFVALVVDALIVMTLSSLLAALLGPLLPSGLGYAVWATLSFLLTWGYHVYFEAYRQGRSPGKRLAGLRVVDARGLPISLEQAFVRNVLRVLDAAPALYGLGALACEIDPQRRRLGDLAADTLVVREARRAQAGETVARSREHNSLRVPRVLRRVRSSVGLEEREFLLALSQRAEQLEPRARFDLMQDVGEHYRRRLQIDDPHLSGEALVRGLTAVLFWDRRSAPRR